MNVTHRLIDKSHYAAMGLPVVGNAFTGCVPRSSKPGTHKAPAKRGPKSTKVQQAASALRTDAERAADKLAKATAFNKAGENFTIHPSTSKVGTAGSRFATA
jgi:hypothetical protein